jgi:hypothetical protein
VAIQQDVLLDYASLAQLAAAFAYFAVAAAVVWLNPSHRANRAFGVLLSLRGLMMIVGRMSYVSTDAAYWLRVFEYLALALPFALFYFLIAHMNPIDQRWARWTRWSITTAAVLAEVAYAVDHCAAICPAGDLDQMGPLALISMSTPLSFGIAGLLLILAATRQPSSSPQRNSLRLAALPFLLLALFDSLLQILFTAAFGWSAVKAAYVDSPLVPLAFGLWMLGILPAILGLALALREAAAGRSTMSVRRLSVLIGLVLASLLYIVFMPDEPPIIGNFSLFLIGAWRAILPVMIAYAVVRYQLFDIEVKLKLTIKNSTIGAIFVAVFFIISETAQQVFSATIMGPYLGIVGAGFLLLAISPLQQLAERVASASVPHAKAIKDLSQKERHRLFRDHVQLAWADGSLTIKERRLLDHLRERLGLSIEDAARFEKEAMRHL